MESTEGVVVEKAIATEDCAKLEEYYISALLALGAFSLIVIGLQCVVICSQRKSLRQVKAEIFEHQTSKNMTTGRNLLTDFGVEPLPGAGKNKK